MSDIILTNAIVGDNHANQIVSSYSFGVNGLPVCSVQLDNIVKKLLAEEKYDRIYISPGYPLMGIKKIEEIKQKYDEPKSTIPFGKEETGFFAKTNWRQFIQNKKEVELLWNYWRSKVQYLSDLSVNVWILPISLYWFEMKIVEDVPKIYDDVVKDLPQCVDVKSILKSNRFYHNNKFGRLSEQASKLISEAINQ